ncbi:FprA family A-type flavoprotein [Myxococcota bacterium]|nr:FprA family A-type flavoprotein [Myxococcota bacterium]
MIESPHYNSNDPIEIAPGVFHLGVQDARHSFSNIPYLIVDGDEALILDPGSAKPEFYATVLRKVQAVVDPKQIKYMVVQHQDPDLCAALPLFEKLVDPDVKILAPLEAQVLLQHYGCQHDVYPLDDGDTLTMKHGRTLSFIMVPYCHFVGNMITYDARTKLLFSSDVFGGFTGKSLLYADDDYPFQLKVFLGQYLGSKRALEYALKRIELLDKTDGIEMICPQHGCLIKKEQIPMYLEAGHQLEVGGEVEMLAKKYAICLD